MGPKQGRLPEGLAAVGDVAHVLLLALLPRPEGVGFRVGKGNGKKGENGQRPWRSVRAQERWKAGVGSCHCPRAAVEQGICQAAGLPCRALPLLPVLAVGTRAGHAPPLLPGLGLSCEGLLHLQLDLRGAQPTNGQVVSRNVLHCQLLLACEEEKDVVQERKPRPDLLSLRHRLRMSHGS